MDARKKKILSKLIRMHQETAEPVGSKPLVEKGRFPLSPATVRNELAVLEKEGYLASPHTSSGRVPTAKAYDWYLEHLLTERPETSLEARFDIPKVIDEVGLKNLARQLAEATSETAFLAFGPSNTYYTGLSNLFSKPEFQNIDRVVSVSTILDRLDKVVVEFFDRPLKDIEIFLGEQCPFGEDFGTIIVFFVEHQRKNPGLLGLFGPLHMDWEKNLLFMRHICRMLKN